MAAPDDAPATTTGPTASDCLAQAQRHLSEGRLREAQALGERAQQLTRRSADLRGEAAAVLLMAQAELMGSNVRQAWRSSRSAAQLFRRAADEAGEARALALNANACSTLGHGEEALEVALRSTALADRSGDLRLRVLSHNYLAVALMWNADFDAADAAFERTCALAVGLGDDLTARWQPLGNRCTSELFRQFGRRHLQGEAISLERLEQLLEPARALGPLRQGAMLNGASPVIAMLIAEWLEGFAACWSGRLEPARRHLQRSFERVRQLRYSPWLHATVMWLRSEIAWAGGQWDEASQAANEMIAIATLVESESLAVCGHELAAQVYAAQGLHHQAVDELMALRRREQAIRAESLAHRKQVLQESLLLSSR